MFCLSLSLPTRERESPLCPSLPFRPYTTLTEVWFSGAHDVPGPSFTPRGWVTSRFQVVLQSVCYWLA